MQRVKYLLLILTCFLLAGCFDDSSVSKPNITQNQKTHREARLFDAVLKDKFVTLPASVHHGPDHLVVAVSPDHKKFFIMKPSIVKAKKNADRIIKGEAPARMGLYLLDSTLQKTELLLPDVPLMTRAGWNNNGTVLALSGGNRLLIYDMKQKRFLMEDELKNEQVTAFAWSPDGKIIYTEHPNLPNGSIIDPGEGKIVHKYENQAELYYKGKINDKYFYATYIKNPSETELKKHGMPSPQTVITDTQGKIIKTVYEGRFRDAYGRSVLNVGENRFGLYYIPDNMRPQTIKLSDEYIYDARFIYDGRIAYIIKGENPEANDFYLYLTDKKGQTTRKMLVTGTALALSPDGTSLATMGGDNEEINLVDKTMKKPVLSGKEEHEDIIAFLRGAVDCCCKFEMTGQGDYKLLEKYFINTHNPEQSALFDMQTRFKERDYKPFARSYAVNIQLHELKVYGDRASANLGFSSLNSQGSGGGDGWAAELVKKNDKWFITGLSTFPGSTQAQDTRTFIEKLLRQAISANIPGLESLYGQQASVGQVQFWALSEPHPAYTINSANYCKAYIKVKSNGQEKLFKLVLKKSNNSWQVESLRNDRLGSLY